MGGQVAVGAALYGAGMPKDSLIKYETAIKEDSFLAMARGAAEEVACAGALLGSGQPLAP
jgi:hypothetical protein